MGKNNVHRNINKKKKMIIYVKVRFRGNPYVIDAFKQIPKKGL